MSKQIPADSFTKELYELLDETFNQVHGIYLDKGTSLFETLETITAEQASRPVSATCASIAAQVEHVRFYLQVLQGAIVILEMQFANVGRVVTVRFQQRRQRGHILRHFDAVTAAAERRGVLPTEHTLAAGHADRAVAECIFEANPLFDQPVEVWGVDVGIAGAVNCVPSLLVGVQEQDVGPLHPSSNSRYGVRSNDFGRLDRVTSD